MPVLSVIMTASGIDKGTVLYGPGQHIAIRTGPAVTAGAFFVFHPDNGGGYVAELPGDDADWTPEPHTDDEQPEDDSQ